MYELWPVDVCGARIASIQIQLDPEEVVIPVRYLLDGRYGAHVMIPLSISPDVLTFTVLRTLFNVKPGGTLTDAKCRWQLLPIPLRYDPGFYYTIPSGYSNCHMVYSFKATFCPNGRFLAITEQHSLDNEQRIAIFECSTSEDLSVDLVGFQRLPHAFDAMERVAFHPKLPIFAYFVALMLDGTQLKSGAYVWGFKESRCLLASKCQKQAANQFSKPLLSPSCWRAS
jgi:hypothetical protein